MVWTGTKILGKAFAEAGRQAARNATYKPEGVAAAGPVGAGKSKSNITSQLQMSLDEAHLILNVKKDDPMEIIQKNYDLIFAANSPPPPPATPAAAPAAQAGAARRAGATSKAKAIPHSIYLQSKVYRALERIKAERGGEEPPAPLPAAETPAEGTAEQATKS
ncbi:hypothetical protein P7C73_g2471, partial [Tremellales sp. Uapishka_1]